MTGAGTTRTGEVSPVEELHQRHLLLKKLNDLRVNDSGSGTRYHVTPGWRLP